MTRDGKRELRFCLGPKEQEGSRVGRKDGGVMEEKTVENLHFTDLKFRLLLLKSLLGTQRPSDLKEEVSSLLLLFFMNSGDQKLTRLP